MNTNRLARCSCASLLVVAALALSPHVHAEPKARPPGAYWTWDANLEGALGAAFRTPTMLSGFGRARAGLLFVNTRDVSSPHLYSLGVTYELSDFSPATFGIQAEAIDVPLGLWGQVGVLMDVQPRPGGMIAAGFSLIGAEAQVRWDKDAGAFWAVYGKLRIPIGVFGWAVSGKN